MYILRYLDAGTCVPSMQAWPVSSNWIRLVQININNQITYRLESTLQRPSFLGLRPWSPRAGATDIIAASMQKSPTSSVWRCKMPTSKPCAITDTGPMRVATIDADSHAA
jgi:hypothetical protein